MMAAPWLILGLVVLIAVVGRCWRQTRPATSAAKDGLGARPETAIAVDSYRMMDDRLVDERCTCGGRLKPLGESTVRHEDRDLRLVRLECRTCEEARTLYFVGPEV